MGEVKIAVFNETYGNLICGNVYRNYEGLQSREQVLPVSLILVLKLSRAY